MTAETGWRIKVIAPHTHRIHIATLALSHAGVATVAAVAVVIASR